MNNLATSGFALYMSIDRIQNAQLAAERANVKAASTALALKRAEDDLAEATAKYGADSDQAREKAMALSIAQERAAIATTALDQAQQNVSNTMMSSALAVIPSVMTMVGSLSTLYTGLTAGTGMLSGATTALSGAFTALKAVMVAHPLLLIATVIAGIIAALIVAYETCEPFRNAVNQIGDVLNKTLRPALEVVWNALKWLWDLFADNPILSLIFPLGSIAFLMKHWEDITKTLGATWDAVMGGMKFIWDRTIGPIIDGIRWLMDAIAGVGKALGGLGGGAGAGVGASGVGTVVPALPGAAYVGVLPGMQRGGIAFKPTVAVVGEIPEAIVPLSRLGRMGGGVTVEIKSPLVYIEGSADKETVKKAAKDVLKVLDSVIIEATSSGASTKRIREGTRIV
jgi:hypothetical protein